MADAQQATNSAERWLQKEFHFEQDVHFQIYHTHTHTQKRFSFAVQLDRDCQTNANHGEEKPEKDGAIERNRRPETIELGMKTTRSLAINRARRKSIESRLRRRQMKEKQSGNNREMQSTGCGSGLTWRRKKTDLDGKINSRKENVNDASDRDKEGECA
jgi:hypothetical protein